MKGTFIFLIIVSASYAWGTIKNVSGFRSPTTFADVAALISVFSAEKTESGECLIQAQISKLYKGEVVLKSMGMKKQIIFVDNLCTYEKFAKSSDVLPLFLRKDPANKKLITLDGHCKFHVERREQVTDATFDKNQWDIVFQMHEAASKESRRKDQEKLNKNKKKIADP